MLCDSGSLSIRRSIKSPDLNMLCYNDEFLSLADNHICCDVLQNETPSSDVSTIIIVSL